MGSVSEQKEHLRGPASCAASATTELSHLCLPGFSHSFCLSEPSSQLYPLLTAVLTSIGASCGMDILLKFLFF